MKQDTKIIVIAVLIIVAVAIISSNYEKITGQATRKVPGSITKITVSPATVAAGEYITITVVPGEKGSKNDFTIHQENGMRAEQGFFKDKSSRWGTATEKHKLSINLAPGNYYVETYDYLTNSYVKAIFRVIS